MQQEERWRVSERRLTMPMLVSITALVLCLASCGTCRKVTSEETQTVEEVTQEAEDSTVCVEWQMETVGVPMSEVEMSIPIDSLLLLPPAASYSVKSGQANAKVSREGSNVIIYASCDSLDRLVTYYRKESQSYKRRYEDLALTHKALEQTVVEESSNKIKTLFSGLAMGLVAGAVITTVINHLIKRKR